VEAVAAFPGEADPFTFDNIGKAQLDLTLSDQDIADMVDFMNSLTGEFPVIEDL